jgi:multidrug efflux pump subunit AcrB
LIGIPLLTVAYTADFWWYPVKRLGGVLAWVNRATDNVLKDVIIDRLYLPALRFALHNPALVMATAVAVLLMFGSLVTGRIVPFVLMPKLDANSISASINYPDGTPADVTAEATRKLEETIRQLDGKYREQGAPIVELTRRSVGFQSRQEGPGMNAEESGSHLGGVTAELVDTTHREIDSETILAEWRQAAGEFPGAESLRFASRAFGPGGTPIEFKLLAGADEMERLEAAVERTKGRLAEYPGVFDIRDDSRPGKWEFQLRVKDRAQAMGVPMGDLAETVRAAYYGEEVMRLQRGRHEVKLMVRYPREDRRSLAEFDQIRVRTGIAAERPLTELAEVDVQRGYSEINRVDQLRSITISADVDESTANADSLVEELKADFMPALLADFPMVSVRWEGQKEQSDESLASLKTGFGVALVAMFVLLTLQFRSYVQPVMILAIIPFGMVGAVAGHALMGMPLTLFSVFGLVALTGVIVNDSIVLIDFINHRVRDGIPLTEALLDAGRRRFRPVLLTSVTTIAGLTPLLLETSFQAQILIPMATSLSFGLLVGTALVLFLVPTMYKVYGTLVGVGQVDGPPPPVDKAPRETEPIAEPETLVHIA